MLLLRAGDDDSAQERPGWLGEAQRPMVVVAAQDREKRHKHTHPVPLWAVC